MLPCTVDVVGGEVTSGGSIRGSMTPAAQACNTPPTWAHAIYRPKKHCNGTDTVGPTRDLRVDAAGSAYITGATKKTNCRHAGPVERTLSWHKLGIRRDTSLRFARRMQSSTKWAKSAARDAVGPAGSCLRSRARWRAQRPVRSLTLMAVRLCVPVGGNADFAKGSAFNTTRSCSG